MLFVTGPETKVTIEVFHFFVEKMYSCPLVSIFVDIFWKDYYNHWVKRTLSARKKPLLTSILWFGIFLAGFLLAHFLSIRCGEAS